MVLEKVKINDQKSSIIELREEREIFAISFTSRRCKGERRITKVGPGDRIILPPRICFYKV